MGLGVWQKEQIELTVLAEDGEVCGMTMEETFARYGNGNFRVDRKREKHGFLGADGAAFQYFSEKTVY